MNAEAYLARATTDAGAQRVASAIGAEELVGREYPVRGAFALSCTVLGEAFELPNSDSRFDHESDGVPGLAEGHALYGAIPGPAGNCAGVIQIVRTGDERFTAEEADLLKRVIGYVGEFVAGL